MNTTIKVMILATFCIGFNDALGQCENFKIDFGLSSVQNNTMLCAPKLVSFKDSTSLNNDDEITGWQWKFTDTKDSSFLKDPFHTYLNNGQFDVTLEVTSKNGCSGSLTKPNYITITGPSADFTLLEDTTYLSHPVYLINNANKHGLLSGQQAKQVRRTVSWDTINFTTSSDTITLAFFEPRTVNVKLTIEMTIQDPKLGPVKMLRYLSRSRQQRPRNGHLCYWR